MFQWSTQYFNERDQQEWNTELSLRGKEECRISEQNNLKNSQSRSGNLTTKVLQVCPDLSMYDMWSDKSINPFYSDRPSLPPLLRADSRGIQSCLLFTSRTTRGRSWRITWRSRAWWAPWAGRRVGAPWPRRRSVLRSWCPGWPSWPRTTARPSSTRRGTRGGRPATRTMGGIVRFEKKICPSHFWPFLDVTCDICQDMKDMMDMMTNERTWWPMRGPDDPCDDLMTILKCCTVLNTFIHC